MQNTAALTAGGYSTIFGRMLREAIIAERNRRNWNNLKLATEAGVPYSRLYEWLNNRKKRIHSEHIERLMDTLELTISHRRPGCPKGKTR